MVARTGAGEDARSIDLPSMRYEDELEARRERRAIARRQTYRDAQQQSEQPPSPREYALLGSLHAAQESPGFDGLLAAELTTSGYDLTYPEHENVPQKIFGGYVIHRAFMYAALCAELVTPDRPAIVAVNRINFLHPVRIADRLHFTSRVTYTGTTSICVETDIVRVSRDRSSAALSNTCAFTFASVDTDLRRKPVPQIFPTTYAEDARYLAAYRRHETHKAFLVRTSS
jgi:acyl-coenzyme A thioesterase 9